MPVVSAEGPVQSRRRGWATFGVGVLTLAATLALAGMAYVRWANTLPSREPDPRPHLAEDGFQPCMEVASKLTPIPIWGSETQWLTIHATAVRQMSLTERASLDRLHHVAQMELRIPHDGDGQDPAFDPLNNALRRVFAASKVAREEGDRDTAVDRALTGLELGSRLGRGGLLYYGVVSCAIARVTVARLEPWLNELSATEAHNAGKRMDTVLARLPSLAEVVKGERRYGLARFAERLRTGGPDLLPAEWMPGWVPANLRQPSLRRFLWSLYSKPFAYAEADQYYRSMLAEMEKPLLSRRDLPLPNDPLARNWVAPLSGRLTLLLAAQTTLVLLRLELALEEYRKIYGHYPARLEMLVPKVLSSLSNEPFTEKPFHYRLTRDGYLLYSAGPNHQDDGGSPSPQGIFPLGGGDLVAGKTAQTLPQR